ncbi:hypothetical protein [Amycolatopsis silviterrae]|uniref:Uncharacterized protein n=1 Tax=Amycolatopsis silviterrae TaxID=1656914 RepID=A0ABW5HDH8_9PSEU
MATQPDGRDENEQDKPEAGASVSRERLLSAECRCCGAAVEVAGTGRRPRYCSAACRQKAWALRKAAEQLGQDPPGPAVVREVVARERTRTVREVRAPRHVAEWIDHLHALHLQLLAAEARGRTGEWVLHQDLAAMLSVTLAALGRMDRSIDWAQLPVRPRQKRA